MRKIAIFALLALIGTSLMGTPVRSHEGEHAVASDEPELRLENLLKAQLEGVEGTEVIVSRVSMPPNTTLPKHWHPGEEFGYVIEGSVVLWQEGKEDLLIESGDVAVVPLKQVHTAMTKDEGATLIVFRVHELGKPERVLVD